MRGYDIREACVVHLARYQSRSSDGRLLALRMTRPVFRTNNDSDTGSFQGIVGLPSERKNRAGFVSEWFEASLRSAKAEKAFELNKSLQTGEKAGWTGEELNEAGVFDGLCRLGLSLIPKMDSIGIANDNGYHPSMTTDARAQASSEDYAAYEPGFW